MILFGIIPENRGCWFPRFIEMYPFLNLFSPDQRRLYESLDNSQARSASLRCFRLTHRQARERGECPSPFPKAAHTLIRNAFDY